MKKRPAMEDTRVMGERDLPARPGGPGRWFALVLGLGVAAGGASLLVPATPQRPAQVLMQWDGPRLTVRALPRPHLELEVLEATPTGRRLPLVLDDGWLSARFEPASDAPLRLVSRPPGILDLEIPRIDPPAFPDDLLNFELDMPGLRGGEWFCQFTADRQPSHQVTGVTEGTTVRFPWTPPRTARFVGISSLEGSCPVPGEPPLTVSLNARIDRNLPTLSWLQEDLIEQLDPRSRGAAPTLAPGTVKKLLATAHGLPEGAEPAAWSETERLYRRRLARVKLDDPARLGWLEWLEWTWLLEVLARAHVVDPPIHVLDVLSPHLRYRLEPIGSRKLRSDFSPVGMYYMSPGQDALTGVSFEIARGAFGKGLLEPETPERPAWVLKLEELEGWRDSAELEPLTDGEVGDADPLGIRLTIWHFIRRQPYVLTFESPDSSRTRRLYFGNELDRGHHANPHGEFPYSGDPGSWKNLPVTGNRVEMVVPRSYVGKELPRKVSVRMLDMPDPRRDSKYTTMIGVEWFDPGAKGETIR